LPSLRSKDVNLWAGREELLQPFCLSFDGTEMQSRNQFSCFIIGEGTLPIQCGEILLNGGHEICGIISPDEVVNRWAHGKKISHADTSDDLIKLLRQRPFDYLFSIVNVINYQALLQASLELPRKGAINYHDAPLPRYAGFYPTSWALMNREATHGITWHLMTEVIDAGDILKECPVDISNDDTAFTLNAKCYDAAIRSFAGLVEDLSSGRASTRKQDLEERTFFPLHQRPATGWVISWNGYARDIDAFVRALDFGPYPNPLGLPKLSTGKEFFIVPKIDILDSISDAASLRRTVVVKSTTPIPLIEQTSCQLASNDVESVSIYGTN
jgi:folate-dependent phosphoribosylglycinamide formyltransferase PurN